MTIRDRNRVNFIFLIVSLIILLMNAAFFLYYFFTGNITSPQILRSSKSFLFSYSFFSVIGSIFILNIYVVLISYIIIRTFEKSQATEVLYFLMFLASVLLDTARLYIPIYSLAGTYSQTLIRIGNHILAARLLGPLSLFALAIFSEEEFRQRTELICVIALLIAILFANFIPLNTAVIMPNLCVSYGFTKMIVVLSVILSIISALTLFLHNNKNDFSQIHTVGFILLTIGYYVLISCSSVFSLITGTLLLGTGSALYLIKLHQHYLWID